MSIAIRKPILVSGSPRSGSTWVGTILNLSNVTGYLHEPFNPSYKNTIYPEVLNHMYLHIGEFNENEYYEHFKRQIDFEYKPLDLVQAFVNTRNIKNAIGEYLRIRKCHQNGYRALLKDPIALFSSEWLAETFNADVLILIRHPAAYVASNLKKIGWRTDFNVILKQTHLMEKYDLYRYEDAMIEQTRNTTDLIENHALMWNICFDVVDQLQQKHNDWLFFRYEDISSDPFKYYKDIFSAFSLPFTNETEQKIMSYSSSKNKSTAQGIFDVQIDSKANISKWKKHLTQEQIERVRDLTDDVASRFYDESEW